MARLVSLSCPSSDGGRGPVAGTRVFIGGFRRSAFPGLFFLFPTATMLLVRFGGYLLCEWLSLGRRLDIVDQPR